MLGIGIHLMVNNKRESFYGFFYYIALEKLYQVCRIAIFDNDFFEDQHEHHM